MDTLGVLRSLSEAEGPRRGSAGRLARIESPGVGVVALELLELVDRTPWVGVSSALLGSSAYGSSVLDDRRERVYPGSRNLYSSCFFRRPSNK